MREILFRGKTSQTKWVYGDIVQEDELTYIRENKNTAENDYYKNYLVYMNTIGQYIGHDDIHRNKIFEGDVVKVHDLMPGISDESRDFEGVVYYRNGSFFIENQYELHYRWMDYQVEVLGNKYDNPELLKMFAVDPRHSKIEGD